MSNHADHEFSMSNWTQLTTSPSTLGESPWWHPQEQMLYWADIAGFQLHRMNVFTSEVQTWRMPSEPGCFAPAQSGGFIIALRERIVRAQAWGGELQTLQCFDHDAKTTRANDGKCDPSGRFWAGTMFEPRTSQEAKLWSYSAAERLQLKQGNAVVANCLAFSPNVNTLYWADTPQHTIWAWDFDVMPGAINNQRIFKQFPAKPAGWQSGLPNNGGYLGRPDGAAVDTQGNLWVAMFEGKRILQIAPSGETLQDIETPVLCCTMPAFGGDDLQTLYLTTARHNRSEAELAREPTLGCVFSMRVNVAGLPVNFYAD
jgi:sugar lactone lactonase YvrE